MVVAGVVVIVVVVFSSSGSSISGSGCCFKKVVVGCSRSRGNCQGLELVGCLRRDFLLARHLLDESGLQRWRSSWQQLSGVEALAGLT